MSGDAELIFFGAVLVFLATYWFWKKPDPMLPKQPFWTKPKVVATAIFVPVYLLVVFEVPKSYTQEYEYEFAIWGLWPMFLIYFPELSLMFKTRLTRDNMTLPQASTAIGWLFLVIWSAVVVGLCVFELSQNGT